MAQFVTRPVRVDAVRIERVEWVPEQDSARIVLAGEKHPAWFTAALLLHETVPGAVQLEKGWGSPFLMVQTSAGPVYARPGQWIVRSRDRQLQVLSPADFDVHYQPDGEV